MVNDLNMSRSLGIRTDPSGPLVAHIKESSDHGSIQEPQLRGILKKFFPTLKESWPSHGDVLRAFQVFDTEGVGFIKVTMLKRFLVQAQLDIDEAVRMFFSFYLRKGRWDKEEEGEVRGGVGV